MKNLEFSKAFIGISLAGVVSLGLAACGGAKNTGPSARAVATTHGSGGDTVHCPTPNNQLHGLRLIGSAKDGGINAVNTGDCVELTDPATGKDAGQAILPKEAFEFLCALPPKEFFEVKTASGIGDVLLSPELAAEMQTSSNIDVPFLDTCPDTSATQL